MRCDIKMEGEKHELQLRLTFEDKMDRELTSELKEGERLIDQSSQLFLLAWIRTGKYMKAGGWIFWGSLVVNSLSNLTLLPFLRW